MPYSFGSRQHSGRIKDELSEKWNVGRQRLRMNIVREHALRDKRSTQFSRYESVGNDSDGYRGNDGFASAPFTR